MKTETEREKEKRSREGDKRILAERRAEIKAGKVELRDVVRKAREGCRGRKLAARVGARNALQEVKEEYNLKRARIKTSREANRERVKEECGINLRRAREPVEQRIEAARRDLAGSIASQRGNRQREASRPRATAKERESEADQRVAYDLKHQHPHLLPVWERMGPAFRRDLGKHTHKTRTEAFVEYVGENPELLELAQAAEQRPNEKLIACQEAKHLAQLGNVDAAIYADTHCDEQGRPKVAKGRKLSAKERTISHPGLGGAPSKASSPVQAVIKAAEQLGAPVVVVEPKKRAKATAAAAAAVVQEAKRGRRRAKVGAAAQETLSVGRMKTALTDTHSGQIPF